MAPPVRILGCGRWSMGDDQAGLVVADRLLERNIPHSVIARDEAPGSEIAGGLSKGVRLLLIVDAARADEQHPPGTAEWIDYRAHPDMLIARASGDTHSISVNTGLQLAETLGLLPDEVWVYAIFGTHFHRRMGMSPATEAGISPLVQRIERDVRRWLVARRVDVRQPSS